MCVIDAWDDDETRVLHETMLKKTERRVPHKLNDLATETWRNEEIRRSL